MQNAKRKDLTRGEKLGCRRPARPPLQPSWFCPCSPYIPNLLYIIFKSEEPVIETFLQDFHELNAVPHLQTAALYR
jgi:hypothetical protein